MNKEDKILEMLENLTHGQSRLETKVDKLETRFDVFETRFDKLETKVDKLETKVDKLETRFDKLETKVDELAVEVADVKSRVADISETVATIEVEHGKQLGALFDGYSLMSDNIKRVLPAVEIAEKTAEDASALKNVVSGHAKIFNAMKEAM